MIEILDLDSFIIALKILFFNFVRTDAWFAQTYRLGSCVALWDFAPLLTTSLYQGCYSRLSSPPSTNMFFYASEGMFPHLK